MENIREVTGSHAFRGNFPNVPTAEGVDLDALRERDPDPLFVTLPVIPEIGVVSRNGLLYDDALASSVEEQIVNKRPGARFGHIKDDEAETAYPHPSAFWVGAKRVGSTLWAKAYVPPGAAREHIRQLRAIGGQIATSIFGKGAYAKAADGARRLTSFALETLDFAPPERAALGYGAVPIVTAEMTEAIAPTVRLRQEAEMPTYQEIVQELRSRTMQPVGTGSGKGAVAADAGPVRELTETVRELRDGIRERDARIAELSQEVMELRGNRFEVALDAKIAELTAWQVKGEQATAKLASFRKMLKTRIVAEMGEAQGLERVAEIVEAIWPEMQPVAEAVRDALAGPPALVGGKRRGEHTLEVTPQTVQAARAKFPGLPE